MSLDKQYYSRGEVGKLFGVSKLTVWRMVDRGELKAVKFGRSLRISKEELERYIKTHETVVDWDGDQ